MKKLNSIMTALAASSIATAPASAQWTFTDLHPAGAAISSATDISDGQQVGWATFGGERHASLWSGTAASWVSLLPAGEYHAHAMGVGEGQQVGASSVATQFHAGIWTHTEPCYADCAQSTGNRVLDVFDFLWVEDAFVTGCL